MNSVTLRYPTKLLRDRGRTHYTSSGKPFTIYCRICSIGIKRFTPYYTVCWPTNAVDIGTVCEKCIDTPTEDIINKERAGSELCQQNHYLN
jgi:hypothetical protein